jgi:putative YhdH/YhfP family quinone oxidoreductase
VVFDLSQRREFPCYLVRKPEGGRASAQVESISWDALPQGDVLIRVAYSSLNYKDALACHGHPGVVREFPHVPGVDCAGTVVESASEDFRPGDDVLVTGYELGAGHWGGFAAYVRVPAEWVVRLPPGLTLRDAMIYGTAGFTAAQCVTAIVERGISPQRGPVVVTGATGGVGSLAVAILAKLGYEVAAVTGKSDRHDWLRRLGAKQLLSRIEVLDTSDRPLLPARWAAAVDTVGGQPLATILRSMKHRGCVTAAARAAGDVAKTGRPVADRESQRPRQRSDAGRPSELRRKNPRGPNRWPHARDPKV